MNLLGYQFRLYHDTSANNGTTPWAASTWAEQNDVGNMGFDRAPKNAEVPKRGTNHTKYKRARFDQRLTVSVNYDPSNAFVTAIEAAVTAGTPLHLAVTDGAIATAGTNIWEADYVIIGDPLDMALDENTAFEVELAPHADSVNEPAKSTVGS